MAYSSITEILFDLPKKEVINLTNDEKRTEDQINFDEANDPCLLRVNKAIEDADSEIDGYLRSRYSLPIPADKIPKLLTNISTDIAKYNLFKRRFVIDIPYSEVYKNRLNELKDIQRGNINLDISEETADNSGYYAINKTSSDRIFSKSELDLF